MTWGGSLVIMMDRDRGRQDEAEQRGTLRVIWIRIMWWPSSQQPRSNDSPWPVTKLTTLADKWPLSQTWDRPQHQQQSHTNGSWSAANNWCQAQHLYHAIMQYSGVVPTASDNTRLNSIIWGRRQQRKCWYDSNCGNTRAGAVVWKHWVLKLGPNNSV